MTILKVISELGVRYEPLGQADLQAHAGRVALLAQDCADLNPLKLRHAAMRWAQHKPFLPKACELRAIVEDMESEEWKAGNTAENLQIVCDERNDWARRIGADWWYRVITIERGEGKVCTVEKLEGRKARDEQARAGGTRIEWYRPTLADLASIHAFARRCMEQDMTQQEFNALVQRTGGAPIAQVER
ncbi:MAG: hypothetical protein LBV29_01170 [Azoarcus sp.]|jgi:hypothetical protein|nr:hypothetical protein [Azoarcus sp.]